MRSTKMLLISSFFLAANLQATSQANDTFDMNLPEAVTQPTSSNFVNSYENDLGRKAAPAVVTSYEEPAVSPHQIAEEPQGGYSSAFTSYRSQKSPEEIAEAQKEAWNKSQDNSDGFDLDGLADSPVEDNKYFAAPSSVNKYIHMSSNVKSPAKAKKVTANRAPASEDIPLPDGIDLSNEIEKLDSAPASSESSGAPVSAKERKEMILRTISQNYRDLKNCYNDGLKKSSEMKGKVVMGWAMDGQGRVSGAEVQTSQLNNKQVEKCMVDRLSGWRFPRQAKLQGSKDRMTYTFQFVSERD